MIRPFHRSFHTVYKSRWAKEHLEDAYVKLAHKEGYRCRSAYKLLELHQQFKLFKPGLSVLDLGASPGSWSQIAAKFMFRGCNKSVSHKLVAVDIQSIEPIPNVTVLGGRDIRLGSTHSEIDSLMPAGAHVIMSDMAPSPTGIRDIDEHGIVELCKVANSIARDLLKDGGTFLCKVWHGNPAEKFQQSISDQFENIKTFIPKATKRGSRELYIVGRGFKKLMKKID